MKMSAIKESKNMGEGDGSGSSKKAKKMTYEKQLEAISNELQQSKSGTGVKGQKKQKLRPEQEIVLLEQKCVVLLKLKKFKDVVDDGYSIIGRMGPNVTVYKCILIALVKLGKSEDDFQELLEAWKKATPKCPDLLEAKRKFDGYVAALRSGVKLSDIFSGVSVEDALNLNADAVLSKQPADAIAPVQEETKWRFRAPPPRHTTFSMCPRSSPPNTCMYGNECTFAHSLEELKEWKMRVDVDKKSNNLLLLSEEENAVIDKESAAGAAGKKKIFVPPTYRSLLIPPLCIHYLLDMGRKIKEASSISEILTDDIPGVKIKVETPLDYRKRPDSSGKIQCHWSFMVGSKMPMGTVSILHDSNRDLFGITTGLYYNKKKESIGLIELHPNNKVQTKIQVLNTFIQPALFLRFNSGWPDVCYYRVEIDFEARPPFPEPRLVRQSIVFDFKKDPKVVRHISVDILPKIEPIGNHLTESSSSKTASALWSSSSPPESVDPFSHSESLGLGPSVFQSYNNGERDVQHVKEFSTKLTDFPSLTQFSNDVVASGPSKEVEVLDSESGKLIEFKSKELCLTDAEEWELPDHNNLFLENVPLTKESYRTWMRDFLDVELISRQKAVNSLKKRLEVKLSQTCMKNPEYMYRFPFTGDLYGNIDLMSGVFCDLKVERLINSSCQSVIISASDIPSPFILRKPSGRYICNIICKSKSAICFAIGGKARENIQLMSESKLDVNFVLDNSYFDQIKSMLESLSDYHLELLFPDFENSKLPFLKVMDSIGLVNDEELLLNNRQMTVYNLVTGRKVLIDGDVFTPPVLVLGGACTGKSYLLAHCIKGIIRSNTYLRPNRILICTQTDLNADTYITEYLHQWLINDELSVQRSKPLRVYDKSRYVDSVSGAVKHYCLFDMDGLNFRYPTREEVMSHRIIITTFPICSELIKLDLEEDTFSHIIIDEATSCLEVECVLPIVLAGRKSKIVLAGDVMQSQTSIFSISKGVPPISLLERLRNMYPFKHPFVVNLVENYVNHEVIAKFVSKEFYQDQLRSVSSQPSHPKYYPLNFYHIPTGEMQPSNGGGSYNLEEIRHVVDFIEELIRTWPEIWGKLDSTENKQNVVILTPFTNHIDRLRVYLQVKGLDAVNVELASNILGRKFRVVIISTVQTYKESLTNPNESVIDSGFFSDRRLLCSALSAAKSLVVAFGDAHSLWSHGTCRDIWQKYITECQRNQSLIDLKALSATAPRAEDSKQDTNAAVIGVRETNNGMKPQSAVPSLLVSQGKERTALYIDPSSISTSESSTPRQLMSIPVTLPHPSTILPTIQSSRMDPVSSFNTADNSWGFNAVHSDAPKTDLFSAFSTTSGTLYGSKSPTLPVENENVAKEPEPTSLAKLSLSDAIASFTGMANSNSTQVVNPASSEPLQIMSKLAPIHIPTTLRSSSDVFTAPLEFPPLDMPARGLENKISLEREHKDDLNIIQPQPMPLPVPTIPSHVLYDQSFLMNSRSNCIAKPVDQPRNQFDQGNATDTSTKIPSLLRSPPGFAPMTVTETVFPTLADKSFPTPGSPCNGGIVPKYSYKKSTYELPPRLRNLQMATNNRSPLKKAQTVFTKPQPPEMNFFDELGLNSNPAATLSREVSRSASSASSDHSLFDMDETGSVADEECTNDPGSDDWIEVKSTRRGKHQTVKKKGKSKRVPCADKDLTSDFGKGSEMCVDDKVEIIIQMGFSKSQAIKALQACEKDLQGAVDWLISKPSKSAT